MMGKYESIPEPEDESKRWGRRLAGLVKHEFALGPVSTHVGYKGVNEAGRNAWQCVARRFRAECIAPYEASVTEVRETMTPEMLIKGVLPVCRKCREACGEEPDKCGKYVHCKVAFTAGAVWQREECAKIADMEAELHDRFALEDAGTEGAVEHSIVAAEASRIAQRIRGRP